MQLKRLLAALVVGVVALAACSGLYAPEPTPDDTAAAQVAPQNSSIRVISNSVAPAISRPAQLDPTATALPPVAVNQALAVEDVFVNIYERVSPSVVNIEVVDERSSTDAIDSSGSGFVYDLQGHIITNAHVVLDAREILVTFPNGTVSQGVVVGTDEFSDLAVIRVEVGPGVLLPVAFGDSLGIRVGEYIVAIGSPFGLENSMTTGIISATGRSLSSQRLINPLTEQIYNNPSIIQIDAAVNPGNSGGPILNLQGEVVGVATAIRSDTGVFQGVAYAVPVNTVLRVVPQLIENGSAVYPWLGVQAAPTDEAGLSMPVLAAEYGLATNRGVLITGVLDGSPAFQAGLQGGSEVVVFRGRQFSLGGDIIVAIDGENINDLDELLTYLVERTSPGEAVVLTVIRGEQTLAVPLTLGVRPD